MDNPFFENIPLMEPPPGQVSNFNNPPSQGIIAVVVGSICMGLVWPVFVLRIYAKVWVTRAFWWDDCVAIVAIIGNSAFAAAVIKGMSFFGPHAWNVPVSAVTTEFLQLNTIVCLMGYGITILFAKLSLFLLYLRIFSCSRTVRWIIYLGMISCAGFYVATSIYFGYGCIPQPTETWVTAAMNPRCTSTTSMDYAQGIFGLISDLYLYILPIPVVAGLNLSLQRKLGVLAIFGAGFIAVFASILGLYYRIVAYGNPDITWNQVPTLTLALVEITLEVICSSLPHIVCLFRRRYRVTAIFSNWRYYLLRQTRSSRSSKKHSGRPSDELDQESKVKIDLKAPRLETYLLGTIKGQGKFVQTGNFSQTSRDRSSLNPFATTATTSEVPTIRDSLE